jgi:hypothetical protein
MEIEALPYRLTGDRAVVSEFLDSEEIYYRLKMPEGSELKIDPNDIDMPSFSVDRGLFTTKPADVVHKYPGQSVAVTTVGEIRKIEQTHEHREGMDTPITLRFTCDLGHIPEPDNYAHSEVNLLKNGNKISDIKNKVVKTKIRAMLASLFHQRVLRFVNA